MSQNFLNGPETTINVTTIARLVQTEFLKLQRFFSKKKMLERIRTNEQQSKTSFFSKSLKT